MKKFDCILHYSKTTKDSKKVQKVLEKFIENLVEYLVTTGFNIRLPYTLGTMRFFKVNIAKINRNKNSKYHIYDYKTSNDIGKKVKHLNMSTDGYWWKFLWYKSPKYNIISRYFYTCLLVRSLRRGTSYPGKPKNPYNLLDFFKDKGYLIYNELPSSKTLLNTLE